MKARVLVVVLVLLVSAYADQYMSFDQFITTFKKTYTKGSEEYVQKEKIYNKNIEQLKAKNCSVCGVTKFFDVTSEDFSKKKLTLEIPDVKVSANINQQNSTIRKLAAPPYIDWRQRGVITSIKDQGECGCCWSFATVALSESYLILKGQADKSINLSQQYLLRCTPEGDCDGGYLENALKQVYTYGLPPDSKYPYQPYTPNSRSDICSGTYNKKITSDRPRSYYDISTENLKNLLMEGPLAIAIDSTNWQYYVRGTWRCTTRDINHAVLLVGYTSDNRWIIKNQWGQDWGENGYMYISMSPSENCQIGSAVHKFSSSSQTTFYPTGPSSNFPSIFPSIFKFEMMMLIKGIGLGLLLMICML